MPRFGFAVIAAVLIAWPGQASTQKGQAPQADVECGKPEWTPFKDAVKAFCSAKKPHKQCERALKAFEKCKACPDDDSVSVTDIPAKDVAKGKFAYQVMCPDVEFVVIQFAKAKEWTVKKMSTKPYSPPKPQSAR